VEVPGALVLAAEVGAHRVHVAAHGHAVKEADAHAAAEHLHALLAGRGHVAALAQAQQPLEVGAARPQPRLARLPEHAPQAEAGGGERQPQRPPHRALARHRRQARLREARRHATRLLQRLRLQRRCRV